MKGTKVVLMCVLRSCSRCCSVRRALNAPQCSICLFVFESRLIVNTRTRRLPDFTCFLANGGEVGSHVSVSGVGQLRQLLPGGAARRRPELLLQNVGALRCAGNPDLPSGNNQ